MYSDLLTKMTNGAQSKLNMLNESKTKYFVASAFAGLFVGVSMLFAIVLASILKDAGIETYKIAMGAVFGVALTLVVFAGANLFTSNTMIFSVGSFTNKISWKDTFRACGYSYIGNFLGSLFVVLLFVGGGLLLSGSVADMAHATAAGKVDATFMQIFFKGVLCNILVCSAVICITNMTSEVGKIIVIYAAIFLFVTAGFEHSIANMTVFLTAAVSNAPIALSAMANNLVAATLGNIVGGAIVMGGGYYILGRETVESPQPTTVAQKNLVPTDAKVKAHA